MQVRETKITVEQVPEAPQLWRAYCDDEARLKSGNYAPNPLVAIYNALFRLGDIEQTAELERDFIEHLRSKGRI